MIVYEQNNNSNRISIIPIMMFLSVLIIMGFLIAFVWIPSLENQKKLDELVNTGIHTTATINDYVLATETDEEKYYNLCYVFDDANAVQHNGKTREQYSYNQATHYAQEHIQIEIIYNPETFESVEASYTPSSLGLWILPLIAIIFVVMFSIPLITDIKKVVASRKTTNDDYPVKSNTNNANFKTKTDEDFIAEWQEMFPDDHIFGWDKKEFKTQFITFKSVNSALLDLEGYIEGLVDDLLQYGPTEEELAKGEEILLREARKAEDYIIEERKLEENSIKVLTLEKLKELEDYCRKNTEAILEQDAKSNVSTSSSNDDIYKYEKPFK